MGKRAYGAYTIQRARAEDDYGVGGVGNWTKRPFYSSTFGAEQPLVVDPRLLGLGREPPKPDQGVIDVLGNIVVPVDQRHSGFWLKMLFGPPTTTGSAPYVHAYKSGAEELPSFERELQHTQTLAFALARGCVANTGAIEWSRSGKPQLTLDVIGQSEVLAGTAAEGAEDDIPYDGFSAFMGSVKRAGAPLGNVVGARMTYSNGVYAVGNIRPDGLIDGADPGPITVSGELNIRFDGMTLLTAASDGQPIDIELGHTDPVSGHSLLWNMHEMYLPRPKLQVDGPDGVQARYAFQAALNETAGASITATLTNDVPSY